MVDFYQIKGFPIIEINSITMGLRLIVILLLLSQSLFSQDRSLIGRVVESGTEKPIKDVNITIPGTTIATFSNHLGYFEVAVDRAKYTTLQISHINYKILQLQIPAEDRFKLYLEKDTVLLNVLNLNQYPKIGAGTSGRKNNADSLAIESEALFPGGMESFYNYMGNALAPMLSQLDTTGLEVIFTINETGQAADFSISDVNERTKASVIIAFDKMPAWIPATQRQKKVNQLFVLPVKRFIVPDPKSLDVKELYSFIQRNIKYPAQARRMGIEGAVYIEFDTDETGNVVHTKLLKGLDESCNEEVKRIIGILPSDLVKSLSEEAHKKQFVLPVFFGLDHPYKKDRVLALPTKALILSPIDIMAGPLTVVRREVGGRSASTRPWNSTNYPMDPTYLTLKDALKEPKATKRLMLRSKGLTSFPADILTLENLNFLDLENNQLQTLPGEIGTLTELKELYFVGNKLTSLPDNVSNLKKLKTLGLAGNQFKSFPLQITTLEKLEALDLNSNQLSVIPPEIGWMKNLEELYLVNNNIKSIPPEIYELKKLKKIYLKGNPINPEDLALLKKTFTKAEIDF